MMLQFLLGFVSAVLIIAYKAEIGALIEKVYNWMKTKWG